MADSKNGSQAATATAPAGSEGKGRRRKKITKVEAVRRAMEALGDEAARPDIQGYVRQKFGVAMSLDHISNCKSVLANRASRQKQAAKAARKAAVAHAPAAAPSPAAATHARTAGADGSAGATIRIQDVLLAKELLDRVGARPLKALIDGLAR